MIAAPQHALSMPMTKLQPRRAAGHSKGCLLPSHILTSPTSATLPCPPAPAPCSLIPINYTGYVAPPDAVDGDINGEFLKMTMSSLPTGSSLLWCVALWPHGIAGAMRRPCPACRRQGLLACPPANVLSRQPPL
jgi:hypothetical protein